MQRTLLTGLAVGVSFTAIASAQGLPDPTLLLINEIRIDNVGVDVDEYFELLTFPGGATLDGVTYLVIGDSTGGGSGVIENVTDLTGLASNNMGLFLAATSNFTLGATPDLVTTFAFENSDNVTHLVVGGFTGMVGDDLDTNDDGVLDVTPWTRVWDAVSLVETTDVPLMGEYFYGSALGGNDVGPDGTFVPGHVFRCLTSLSDWRIGVFDPVGISDTPRSFNTSCTSSSSTFCDPAELNQTGLPGVISMTGTGSIQLNDSALLAEQLPDNFGVFVQADMTMPAVPASIGGNICLSGNIFRMNRIVAIVGGTTSLQLDFTDPMNVESMTSAGETLYYQLFYRDTTFAGGGNYTNGVAVTWVP